MRVLELQVAARVRWRGIPTLRPVSPTYALSSSPSCPKGGRLEVSTTTGGRGERATHAVAGPGTGLALPGAGAREVRPGGWPALERPSPRGDLEAPVVPTTHSASNWLGVMMSAIGTTFSL